MICKYYSGYTWSILFGMIITGSARSIVVKLAYQSGFRAPLTITLLYLLGQSLSLFVYGIQKRFVHDYDALSITGGSREPAPNRNKIPALELGTLRGVDVDDDKQQGDDANALPTKQFDSAISVGSDSVLTRSLPISPAPSPTSIPSDSSSVSSSILEFYAIARASFYGDEISNGSTHGLSSESDERIKWVHRVPFYAKPAIPAIFSLFNTALRWTSLIYIDASVAEMLISGLELALSVVAARIVRKRIVAKSRWLGVVIVAAGVIVIERGNYSKHKKSGSKEENDASDLHSGANEAMIGLVLIILQSVLSVMQDLGEEIFMQATDFPATMMLGLEGLYGFCLGLIIYLTLGDKLGIEDIYSTMSMLGKNPSLRWWVVGLPFLFLITGIFNIKATEVTSAMTRNVWKNMRTVLVWVVALGIFYLGKNPAFGEAWHTPESFVILLGFGVMSAGIIVYYSAH